MGGFSSAVSSAAVGRAVLNAVWAQVHTGDPGSTGTANAAGAVGRVLVTWAAGTAPSQSCTAAWTIPAGGGGPYTYWSLWSAQTGGDFQAAGQLLDDAGSAASFQFGTTGQLSTTLTATDGGVLA